MALSLQISRQAGRFIKTLPPKQYKHVVSTTLALLTNPEPHDSQQLKGSKDTCRACNWGIAREFWNYCAWCREPVRHD